MNLRKLSVTKVKGTPLRFIHVTHLKRKFSFNYYPFKCVTRPDLSGVPSTNIGLNVHTMHTDAMSTLLKIIILQNGIKVVVQSGCS